MGRFRDPRPRRVPHREVDVDRLERERGWLGPEWRDPQQAPFPSELRPSPCSLADFTHNIGTKEAQ